MTDFWPHQTGALAHLDAARFAMLDIGMGCGKSRIVVEHLVRRRANRVLIGCPKSVVGVWRREIASWAGLGRADGILVLDEGTGEERAALAEGLWRMRPRLWVVANYETLRMRSDRTADPLGAWAVSKRWDVVTADEVHRLKAPDGQASRGMYEIGRRAGRRIGMTGTLMPHGPLDVWAQFRFVDVNLFGNAFAPFRRRFAVTTPDGKKVVRWQDTEGLAAVMRKVTFTAKAEDTDISLPGVIHHERVSPLTGEAARIYGELESKARAEALHGDLTATSSLALCVRLRQVVSGIVDVDGERQMVESGKLDAVADLVADADGPVVVYCQWRGEVAAVERIAAAQGLTFGEVTGRRKDLADDGTMPEGIDVLAVQLQAGSVGIDLTRARHCVFLSHPWSPGDYEQALARVHRPGQTRSVHCWHLLSERTVDEQVWRALAEKRDVIAQVASHLRA